MGVFYWVVITYDVGVAAQLKMSSGEFDKTLLAFLNGLSRRQYFGEDQYSDQFLREEILGGIEEEG